MGKYRYERIPPVSGSNSNVIRFDSSPRYSITKQYGFYHDSFELREISRSDDEVVYDVYAASTAEGKPQRRGRMYEVTDSKIARVMG